MYPRPSNTILKRYIEFVAGFIIAVTYIAPISKLIGEKLPREFSITQCTIAGLNTSKCAGIFEELQEFGINVVDQRLGGLLNQRADVF